MLYALLFGMAFNFLTEDERFAPGIQFASRNILRIGVALLGLRITMTEVADLGWPVVARSVLRATSRSCQQAQSQSVARRLRLRSLQCFRIIRTMNATRS
jgi:hypothetical protein